MPTIEHGGISYEINEDGFLAKFPEEFDRNWIEYVCISEGIDLPITIEHENAIKKLRDYYQEKRRVPLLRNIRKITEVPLAKIYETFGRPSVAGKMAGFPERFC